MARVHSSSQLPWISHPPFGSALGTLRFPRGLSYLASEPTSPPSLPRYFLKWTAALEGRAVGHNAFELYGNAPVRTFIFAEHRALVNDVFHRQRIGVLKTRMKNENKAGYITQAVVIQTAPGYS